MVKILLENNARHDITDSNQSSPLWIASKEGHSDIVLLLLKKGANPDHKANDGTTPLYQSSYEGHVLCVYHLVSYKCCVHYAKNSGASPLFVAARNGHHRIVKCLLKNGADPSQYQKDLRSPLHTALLYNRIRCIRLLLLRSKTNNLLEQVDIYGWTYLHFLAKKGHMKGARVLFHYLKMSKKSINIHGKDCFGNTPLHIAMFNKKIKFANYLISKGFDVNEENSFGWTYKKYLSKNQENMNKNESPEEYFTNLLLKHHVTNTPEVKIIAEEVQNYVEELSLYVSKLNPLFENNIIQSGSYYENTRVGLPDEFDFMINLKKIQNLCQFNENQSDPSGFGRLYSINTDESYEQLSSYIEPITKCISAEKIRKQFYQLLTSARSHVIRKEISSKFKHLKFEWTSGDKRCGTAIHAEWYGKQYPYLSIKIDVVPCLTIYSQPKDLNKNSEWKKAEFHIIARSPNIDQTYLWRISTSKVELLYFQSLTEEQTKAYIVLKILRMLNEVKYKVDKIDYTADDLITSYMFKNEFFYELIRYPNLGQWNNKSLINRLLGILKRLNKHLINGSIKSFFIKDYNVIDTDDYQKLRSFEIKYLRILFKQLKEILNQTKIRRNTISSIQPITRKHTLRERAATTES